MPTTIGVLELPFGNTRLQVARLFNCLLTFNYNPINQELHTLGSLGVLLVSLTDDLVSSDWMTWF